MLPVKKISRTKTRSRRAHHAMRPVNYSLCKKCGSAKLPHSACGQCGYVNDSMTLNLADKAEN